MKQRDASIYNEDYQALILKLVAVRKAKGVSQEELAKRIGFGQYDVSKAESCLRRLDIIELRDWLKALGGNDDILKQAMKSLTGLK